MEDREGQPGPDLEEEYDSESAEQVPRELRRYALTAAVSAGVLLFALAFFMAGFAAHALLEDSGDGGGSGDGVVAVSAAADAPAWGPEDAPVTIEEFGDFQCPFCARFARDTLPKIRAAYGNKVRFIFRDFPITSIHQYAQKAAEAAQCAHEQGRFWEYHDILFANQNALTVPDLKRYAQQVGMDMQEFNTCLDSGKNAWGVLLDVQYGNRAGVTGTPAFLINGVLVGGALPFPQFQVLIEQALAAATK